MAEPGKDHGRVRPEKSLKAAAGPDDDRIGTGTARDESEHMGRLRALLVSGVAAGMAMVMVVMGAVIWQMTVAGPGQGTSAQSLAQGAETATSPTDPGFVIQDVYELVPVDDGSGATSASAPGQTAAEPANDGAPTNSPATAEVVTTGATGSGSISSGPALANKAPTPAASPPTKVTPSPTTTTPAPTPTTTTLPPGVPADWPAGKPIPPMPAGCQKPQLEDNGVWNCDH